MRWGFGTKRFRSPLVKIAKVIIRWLFFGGQLCIAFLVMGANPITMTLNPSSYYHVIVGMFLLAGTIFWIIPETVTPIAGFIGDCWASVFFPNARFQKPPLSYLHVEFYCKHGRHEEAIVEYLKIIRHYPDEQRAYLDVIHLCKTIGATEMAAKYERRFRKRFRTVQGRQRNRS
jgi:hypothetical protein